MRNKAKMTARRKAQMSAPSNLRAANVDNIVRLQPAKKRAGRAAPDKDKLTTRRKAPLATPSDLKPAAIKNISAALAALLADTFTLYIKTKNFHWHMSGSHFRDYHLLLDEHGTQIYNMTDDMAERARKIGGTTIRSIGHIARLQRIPDNDADYVDPMDMLSELREDNKALVMSMRTMHDLCDDAGDVATASLLEVWIDESQRRVWFLFEATRNER